MFVSFQPAVGPLFSTRCGSALFCHPSRSSGPQTKTSSRRQASVLDRASDFLSPASSSMFVFTQTADLHSRAALAPRASLISQCGGLGSSRACVVSTRLFVRARADPRVRCAWSGGLPAPLAPLPSARCACRGRCLPESSVALNYRFTLRQWS